METQNRDAGLFSRLNMDFRTVLEQAKRVREKISNTKRDLGAVDFEWYPHDTFGAVTHMDRLLSGSNRSLFGARKLRVLDLGCQDGELSFLLESLGHEVIAVDHPVYSHNGMKGVRTLKTALGSSIELREIDLDRPFSLPHANYDIAVFLGVLYHLRNPFYALEEVARSASYCLLNTRIARCFPDGSDMPKNVAMAYLLEERELNNDPNNYFIFSEAGLRVMLRRTHWNVKEYMTVGCEAKSDPVRTDRDERVFCLLETRYGQLRNLELLDGWHESEGTGWRWTHQEFSARIHWNNSFRPRSLNVRLFLIEELLNRFNPLQVSLSLNDCALAPELYRAPGPHKLTRGIGPSQNNEFLLRCRLNGALAPSEVDERERGLVVESIDLE